MVVPPWGVYSAAAHRRRRSIVLLAVWCASSALVGRAAPADAAAHGSGDAGRDTHALRALAEDGDDDVGARLLRDFRLVDAARAARPAPASRMDELLAKVIKGGLLEMIFLEILSYSRRRGASGWRAPRVAQGVRASAWIVARAVLCSPRQRRGAACGAAGLLPRVTTPAQTVAGDVLAKVGCGGVAMTAHTRAVHPERLQISHDERHRNRRPRADRSTVVADDFVFKNRRFHSQTTTNSERHLRRAARRARHHHRRHGLVRRGVRHDEWPVPCAVFTRLPRG